MKYIKKYENFSKDGIEVDNQSYPEYNQADQLKAKEYVEKIFNQGAGESVKQLCKEVGIEIPKEDSELEFAKETAIKYFMDNPERIKETEFSFKSYPYKGGADDRLVKTNNVGGVYRESIVSDKRPSKDGEGCVKIDISDDDMNLFRRESLLIKLLNKNKISLHDNEVWYFEGDEQTKKVLDIFFEIDEESMNEGFGTILLTVIAAYELLKWILRILVKRARGKFINHLKSSLKLLSAAMVGSKEGMKKALSVSEFSDRYYIRGINTFLARVPDIRIMKNENFMIFDESKIELTEDEHKELIDIVVKNL
jgi:hypothetical protein